MTLVTCVGLAVRDIIFTVTELPTGPGKIHAVEQSETGGGPAANAAVAIAALGGSARFVGVLGDDATGDAIVSELEDQSVDASRVRRVPDHRSPLSSVTVDARGERAIVNHTDADLFTKATPSDADLDGSDAVLVDVRWHTGARAGLTWAREYGLPGVLDYDHGDENGPELLALASHVIFSSGALSEMTGTVDPKTGLAKARRATDAWMAVTLGDEGALWLDGDVPRHEPAFAVEVFDTTGAGDVYHGVFALEVAGGSDEPEAMRSASAAAALSCTRLGGRDGVPTRSELDRFLRENQ